MDALVKLPLYLSNILQKSQVQTILLSFKAQNRYCGSAQNQDADRMALGDGIFVLVNNFKRLLSARAE